MTGKITINATGCSLVDRIINGVDFSSAAIKPYISRAAGDGGLTPGHLVFRENLEDFAGEALRSILAAITPPDPSEDINIGGPSIIALICAAQMLREQEVSFQFFQNRGCDENGRYIMDQLKEFAPAIGTVHYTTADGPTAETTVLSDPAHDGGKGERTFINTVGAAGLYPPESLDGDFFGGDILLYGATALTPLIHENLTSLLGKGKAAGKINMVTTVYDFLNESKAPGEKWPLGESSDSYPLIDLLVTDYAEALRLSGTASLKDAVRQFRQWGLPALIVTNGAEDVTFYADGDSSLFSPCGTAVLPVVDYVTREMKSGKTSRGDTTGCGDNFAGGVLVSIADQILKGRDRLDLREAVVLGNCTGASACYHLGGMFREKDPGDKRRRVEFILEKYGEEL